CSKYFSSKVFRRFGSPCSTAFCISSILAILSPIPSRSYSHPTRKNRFIILKKLSKRRVNLSVNSIVQRSSDRKLKYIPDRRSQLRQMPPKRRLPPSFLSDDHRKRSFQHRSRP